MLTNILKSFHLTEKEIRIFERVLELGAQPASSIARVCEIPRNTVRSILDSLVKRGLMVRTRRANTQYYATEKKDNIVRALKYRKAKLAQEIDEQIDLLESYGDELTTRHRSKSRPKITFYEGTAGLEKVYEDTLSASDEEGIVSWASFEGMHDALPAYFKTYYKRRAKKKIPIRSIHPDSPLARERQKSDAEELRSSMLVPSETCSWVPEIQVYGNHVNIASWKEKIGIIIESQEIADALRAVFRLSWEGAKAMKKVAS